MLQQLAQPPLDSSGAPAAAEPAKHPWVEQLRWGSLVPATPLPDPVPVMARLELAEAL
jgi:methionyl-tRNA synthetase